MNDLQTIIGRAVALFIVVGFLYAVYSKIRHETMKQTWDTITDWIGNGKK